MFGDEDRAGAAGFTCGVMYCVTDVFVREGLGADGAMVPGESKVVCLRRGCLRQICLLALCLMLEPDEG